MAKLIFSLILFCAFSFLASAQQIQVAFQADNIGTDKLLRLREDFGINKKLPLRYEKQALVALSFYPELQNIKVKFKIKKKVAPFISRPTVWSTFFRSPHKRTYLIIISDKTLPMLEPILMRNMPYNAQIGVLGHELGHTADFINRKLGKMLNVVFGNLSWKYMDRFEFETDRRAIQHGLGHQILSWSEYAVKSLRINEPQQGKLAGIMERERYMRPQTIRKEMAGLPIYQESLYSAE